METEDQKFVESRIKQHEAKFHKRTRRSVSKEPLLKEKGIFEKVRQLYPGTKRGLNTEFDYFYKKHKDWRQVLPLLLPAVEQQIEHRRKAIGFVPEWKHFRTWLCNRCWEEISEKAKQPAKRVCFRCNKPASIHINYEQKDWCSDECRQKAIREKLI